MAMTDTVESKEPSCPEDTHTASSAQQLCHIALLGDSTLDNVCWTGHPLEIAEQLRQLDDGNMRIANLAADGFNSTDLLKGAVPCISCSKRREIGDPFPDLGIGNTFEPLLCLEALDPPASHAVISIGGNDVREILGNMHRLEEILVQFQSNYLQILKRVCEIVPKVILMFQYRPAFNMDDSYHVYTAIGSLPGPGDAVTKLNKIMETVYAPILDEARNRNLAVIDLPRTCDIYDDSLYICQIEPSSKGGSMIAELIDHAIKNHDFGRSSKLYLKCGELVSAEENDGSCKWSIQQ